ncbi:TetR/AcrR family transcriptional regulator [Conexibacter sp. SYSU D00693]|uniref:TetR/AcrR family transcriptional regulator n=1 Tax=Conexibacter sp. SYSU D00693 TaxID=2812560 RepID=UPI00196A57BE|nr:TetR/AcrR family transcriptional regulator [Conexibacter sp. SYSU D00693]
MPPASATTKRTLSTAEERREALVEAAVRVFAERGFHATPTLDVAKAAGISQAYLFRLFPTKSELFVAAVDRAKDRILRTFDEAAATAGEEGALAAMGMAYEALVERDRDVLRLQLQSQVAAASDPAIRDAARRCFADLHDLVAQRSGASPEELKGFFAAGMLINAMAAVDAEGLDEPWAATLTLRDHDC